MCLMACHQERAGHGESVYLHLYDLNDTFAHMNSATWVAIRDAGPTLSERLIPFYTNYIWNILS